MSLFAIGGASACWGLPVVVEVDRINHAPADPTVFFPPDTMGAIGRNNRFVDLLNTGYSQFDTSTHALIGSNMSLQQFWDTAFTNTFNNPPPGGAPPPLEKSDPNVFDPRILYDDNTQRWYAVSVANRRTNDSRIYVGVTTSNDPSIGNWRGFTIKADSDGQQWADKPTLGYSTQGVFIGAEMFDVPGGAVAPYQNHLTGIPLSSLTAAVPSLAGMRKMENTPATAAFQPAVDVEGITVQSNITYNGFFIERGLNPSFQRMEIPGDFFTGGNLGSPMGIGLNASAAVNAPYDSSLGLPNPIEVDPLEMTGNVVLTLTGYWGVAAVMGPTGTDSLQVFNLHPVSNQLNGGSGNNLITDPNFHFFYPSIGVSPFGEIVVGFNYSFIPPGEDGAFFAPSAAAVAGGWDSNAMFSFGVPNLLQPSSATYQLLLNGRNRWGDYSAVTVRPDNGHDFFSIQEFAHALNSWAISISELIVEGVDTFVLDLKEQLARYIYAIAHPLEGGFTFLTMAMSGQLGSPNLPDELVAIGDIAVENYRFRFDATLDTGGRGGPLVFTDLDALGTQKFTLTTNADGDRIFDTELLGFEVDLPMGMRLTLDDTMPSLGQLGLFDDMRDETLVKSYIDLNLVLQVDTDGDGTFDESYRSLAANRLLLRASQVPEPATLALCLLALAALRLRRAPRARRQ